MADEADYLDLIVANGRIDGWINILNSQNQNLQRKKAVLMELKQSVENNSCYVEEAIQLGGIAILTNILKKTDDEEMMQLCSSIITACSGPMAQGDKVTTINYDNFSIKLREGALGDGLGARVWAVAHLLSREMINHPQIVNNKTVLELGSGTGVCGIVAAKLGAQQVYLTDCEEKVLEILSESVQLNSNFEGAEISQQAMELDDDEDFEEAESVEDFAIWDEGNMHVRYYDWQQSMNFLDNKIWNTELQIQIQISVPQLIQDEQFEVIIGAEVMYELEHADFVAAAIKHKLKKNGICIICCAVRDLAVFMHFEKQCLKKEIQYHKKQILESEIQDDGLIKKSKDYEGGFVMYYLQHQSQQVDWQDLDIQMDQIQIC